MALRLPISTKKMTTLATWLEGKTGIATRYFQNKITNKFPGLSQSEILESVSGFHLYIEAVNINFDTKWYGTIEELHVDQTVYVTILPPKDFSSSRYFQYLGVVSGTPF